MPHTPRNIQSPYVAADFWAQWNSVNPRMALFIKITPQSFWSGVSVVALTSNTRDMTMPGHIGITFKSSPAITPTAIEQLLGEAANLEFSGVYQNGVFERADVLAGKWNYAKVDIFSACWDDGTASGGADKRNYGEFVWGVYKIGEVTDFGAYFKAEVRGQMGQLSNDVSIVTQKSCRVKEFGDAECGKNLNDEVELGGVSFEIRQTDVDGVPGLGGGYDRLIFDISTFAGNLPTDFGELDAYIAGFANGKVTALTGANAGLSREIAGGISEGTFPSMALYLKRLFPFNPEIGDTYTLTMGCTRTLENCRLYQNATNFRGESWIPGIEAVNRVDEVN